MKSTYLFATHTFSPVRWGEIFMNLMTLGFRFDEPIVSNVRVEKNGLVELVIEIGEKTAKYANLDYFLREMGGVKEDVVSDPSQQ